MPPHHVLSVENLESGDQLVKGTKFPTIPLSKQHVDMLFPSIVSVCAHAFFFFHYVIGIIDSQPTFSSFLRGEHFPISLQLSNIIFIGFLNIQPPLFSCFPS